MPRVCFLLCAVVFVGSFALPVMSGLAAGRVKDVDLASEYARCAVACQAAADEAVSAGDVTRAQICETCAHVCAACADLERRQSSATLVARKLSDSVLAECLGVCQAGRSDASQTCAKACSHCLSICSTK